MEEERNMRVTKLTSDTMLRTLESAITFGHPVLLENVGEKLDASLEPILLKQVLNVHFWSLRVHHHFWSPGAAGERGREPGCQPGAHSAQTGTECSLNVP
jgi:hypothetical protein